MRFLQPVVDDGGHGQRPGVPAQEGDVPAAGQTLEAAADVLQGFVEEGRVPEDTVQLQVEQGDAWGRAQITI